MTSLPNSTHTISKPINSTLSIKSQLLSYYNFLKDQINGTIEFTSQFPFNSSSFDDLPHLSPSDILHYIIESVNILLNIKSNSYTSNSSCQIEYESIIQSLEKSLRHHYKTQFELKLKIKALEEYIEEEIKTKEENEKQLNLMAENSSLRKTIEKYEIIIQHADMKEKEMNEEYEIEREKLMNEIRRWEKGVAMEDYHNHVLHKEIHSNVNINFNDISSDFNCAIRENDNGNDIRKNKEEGGKYTHRGMNCSNINRQGLMSTSNFNSNNKSNSKSNSKSKKGELIMTSKTAYQGNKYKGRIIKGKAQNTLLTSKELSLYNDTLQSEDNTIETPIIKEKQLNKKKTLTKLNESLSIKDYYIAIYRKNMNSNTNSPIHYNRFSSNNNSNRHSKQNILITKPSMVISPVRNCNMNMKSNDNTPIGKSINSYRNMHMKSKCNSPQFKKYMQNMQINANKQQQKNLKQKNNATNNHMNLIQNNHLILIKSALIKPYCNKEKESKKSSRQNSQRLFEQ